MRWSLGNARLRRDSHPRVLFSFLFLFSLTSSGCGALSPFAENSIWFSARSIMEDAIEDGKAVVIVETGPRTVWQKTGDPSVSFSVDSDRKKFGSSYRIIPVQPGAYALAGGYAEIPDARYRPDSTAATEVSSRLGRVELTNKDLLEYYEVEVYVPATREWVSDGRGGRRLVETESAHWETRTASRVVGQYVACEIHTPAADASGKPLWAGFSAAPGEIILLQRTVFAAPQADFTRCRSTATFGGSWTCPVQRVALVLDELPALGSVLGVASEEGIPPALVGRITVRELTRGTLFEGPHRQVTLPEALTSIGAYAFEAEVAEASTGGDAP